MKILKMHYLYYDGDKSNPHNCYPIVKCTINGVKLNLLIDTGASSSYLEKDFVEKHPKLKSLMQPLETLKIGSVMYDIESSHFLQTEKLLIDGKRFIEGFYVAPLNIYKGDKYDGMLGMTFFASYGALIDIKNKEIIIR